MGHKSGSMNITAIINRDYSDIYAHSPEFGAQDYCAYLNYR